MAEYAIRVTLGSCQIEGLALDQACPGAGLAVLRNCRAVCLHSCAGACAPNSQLKAQLQVNLHVHSAREMAPYTSGGCSCGTAPATSLDQRVYQDFPFISLCPFPPRSELSCLFACATVPAFCGVVFPGAWLRMPNKEHPAFGLQRTGSGAAARFPPGGPPGWCRKRQKRTILFVFPSTCAGRERNPRGVAKDSQKPEAAHAVAQCSRSARLAAAAAGKGKGNDCATAPFLGSPSPCPFIWPYDHQLYCSMAGFALLRWVRTLLICHSCCAGPLSLDIINPLTLHLS